MNCNVKTKDGSLVGLNEIVYTTTPPAESDFKYSTDMDFNNEPKNIIEEARTLFKVILRLFGIK